MGRKKPGVLSRHTRSKRRPLDVRRRVFAQQCLGVASVFQNFNPDEAAQMHVGKNAAAADPALQHQAMLGVRQGVLEGLEQQAVQLRRKGAFKGFCRLVRDL